MDNKDLVLNLLKGMNTNTQTTQFQSYFDSIYNYYITHKKTTFKNLTDMNKAIIDECYNWLNNNSQESNKTNVNKKAKLETVDLDNLRHKKDGQFGLKLKKREAEFSTLINKPAPKKIDFSMSSKDFPINNDNNNFPTEDLTRLLNQSMEDRQLELQQLQSTKPSAEALKWLNQEENEENKKLETEKNNKKVSFNDELSVQTIINTLSQNSDTIDVKSNIDSNIIKSNIDNNNILDILNEILENQKKIMKLISEK